MELSEQCLKITRDELAALCLHASSDPTRRHLSSVSIDLRTGRVAATNGHKLLAWTGGKVGERQILLPAHGLRSVLGMREPKQPRPLGARRRNGLSPKKERPSLTFTFGADETRVDLVDMSVSLKHVSEIFPPIESVIPKYKEGAPCSCVAVNPMMFADLGRLAKVLDWRLPGVIVQPGPTTLDPILVRFAGDSKWLAVLMPIRIEGTYDAKSKAA